MCKLGQLEAVCARILTHSPVRFSPQPLADHLPVMIVNRPTSTDSYATCTRAANHKVLLSQACGNGRQATHRVKIVKLCPVVVRRFGRRLTPATGPGRVQLIRIGPWVRGRVGPVAQVRSRPVRTYAEGVRLPVCAAPTERPAVALRRIALDPARSFGCEWREESGVEGRVEAHE